MLINLTRDEALACIIELERVKKPYEWQQLALAKLLKVMGLRSKEGLC